MSTKRKTLFADAVTDAKELRETALASAKAALAESFAPKVQSMVSSKLNEMEEELDENFEDDKSLEEILNEMEMDTEDEVITDEPELETGDEFEPEMEDELPLEDESSEEVVDLTVDELKNIIRDVMIELEGSEETEELEIEEPEMEDDTIPFSPEEEEEELGMVAENDELNLDEILSEMGNGYMKEPSDSAAGGAEELIKMIKSAVSKTPSIAKKIMATLETYGAAANQAMRSESLQENKRLKKQLSEVNLLNAKLIFVNKVFKATNLNESKKIAVINAFDRATTVKEVQNTFKTIKESVLGTITKSPLRENKGFASKALGVNKREIITESKADEFVLRMQKLAGINN
jgi:hypothetical protein